LAASTCTSLGQFASAEGKKGGQFPRPPASSACWSPLIAPYKGPRVRPLLRAPAACSCNRRSSSRPTAAGSATYLSTGQESNPTTRRLAIMNLAIRGIEADFGPEHADTSARPAQGPQGQLRPGQSPLQRFRLVSASMMMSAGSTACRPRATPTSPGSSTSVHPSHWASARSRRLRRLRAPLPNGPHVVQSVRLKTTFRKALFEAVPRGLHGIALPGRPLFYSTQIPVCLWFLARRKNDGKRPDRRQQTLSSTPASSATLIDRVHRELTDADIGPKIVGTYMPWRGDKDAGKYKDVAGFLQIRHDRRNPRPTATPTLTPPARLLGGRSGRRRGILRRKRCRVLVA